MTDTIFQDVDTVVEIDETKDYTVDLVGEGKKYKDIPALAKAAIHKDAFIAQLQKETAGLRSELQSRLKLEEFLDKMNSGDKPVPNNSEQPVARQPEAATQDISKTVEALLTEREQQLARQRNIRDVTEKLSGHFGPNYASKVRELANQIGVDEKYLNDLAATAPAAFYRVVGIGQTAAPQEAFTPPPRGSAAFTPKVGGDKKYADYEKLRKEHPDRYWSSSVQNEMQKELQRQGDAFYS